MPEPYQHFNFLGIPREIRDAVYEYTLCSFSQRRGPYDITQCAGLCSRTDVQLCHFTGNLNLLLANKQIHNEGYKIMSEKNLFVVVQIHDSVNECSMIHGHLPPAFVLYSAYHNEREQMRSESYPWHTMRIRLDSKNNMTGDMAMNGEYTEIVMLLEDCMNILQRFGLRVTDEKLPDPNGRLLAMRLPIKVVVELNPKRGGYDRETSYMNLRNSHSAIDQKKLLKCIGNTFRAYDNFEIKNCDEEALAAEVVQQVSKDPSISLALFQAHIERHASNSETSWNQGNIVECANFCTDGLELVHRVRFSAPLVYQLCDDGLQNCFQTSQLIHRLYYLLARCTFAHLSTLVDKRIEEDNYQYIGDTAHALFDLLKTHRKRVHGFLSHYDPPIHEEAEISYMKAKALRVEWEFHSMAPWGEMLRCIEEAKRLQPGNPIYEEEERKAKKWIEDNARYKAWLRTVDWGEYQTMTYWRMDIDKSVFEF
ncbi:hypothetical protein J3E72DRAFT_381595 [Bipolaris maydis]|nr:hypothetical protein BM1_09732 [Bipolaris maydis]KAJ5040652.1 hypothetical protein J3E74DRAFT_479486 [Bipolaris maydis]KAJ5061588.1 hypothetical protein J3E74DRAFT_417023 [Bipolaris maydis]KAJ6203198.1 hypothetical protein J3E72DRAFT_381595 [Bipolaris maydis]